MASAAVQYSATAPHELSQHQQQPLVDTSEKQQPSYKPHDVHANLNYYLDPGDGSLPAPNYSYKPSSYNEKPIDTRNILVHDIRGEEDKYTLDKNGFQIHHHVSREKDFLDDGEIEAVYYPEVEQLLKDATGASKIYIFDHTIRRQLKDSRTSGDADNAVNDAQIMRGPVARVHIDQSYPAASKRVSYHLPEEADKLLAGRFQIINVWRPIKPIYKDPLGVADANSVPDDDLVPIKLIYPDREGETYTVKAGAEKGKERHKWYYLYGQQPDEVMLIKCFDSKKDGRARRVPHSAFVNPSEEHREQRESIEVRCLVFHPDDHE